MVTPRPRQVWWALGILAIACTLLLAVEPEVTELKDIGELRVYPIRSERPTWIHVQYKDGVSHYYRSTAVNALVESPDQRTQIYVGGKALYLREGVQAEDYFDAVYRERAE